MLWFSKIIISLGFVLASLGKLTKSEAVIQMFQEWGFFGGFYLIIGVMELLLGVLILVPKATVNAASILFVIMIGAMITHLIHDPIANVLRPIIFMSFLGIVVYLQVGMKKDKQLIPERG